MRKNKIIIIFIYLFTKKDRNYHKNHNRKCNNIDFFLTNYFFAANPDHLLLFFEHTTTNLFNFTTLNFYNYQFHLSVQLIVYLILEVFFLLLVQIIVFQIIHFLIFMLIRKMMKFLHFQKNFRYQIWLPYLHIHYKGGILFSSPFCAHKLPDPQIR